MIRGSFTDLTMTFGKNLSRDRPNNPIASIYISHYILTRDGDGDWTVVYAKKHWYIKGFRDPCTGDAESIMQVNIVEQGPQKLITEEYFDQDG